jgi:hypothetical protein
MFAEADMGMTQFAMEESQRSGFDQDSKLFVHFYMHPHPDKDATEKEGRPIFKSKEYISIIVPGDKLNIIRRPVTDLERRRFANKYAAFKAGNEQITNGTPLESVPWITREQVEELKYFQIRTLEHLSDLADVHAQKFMGIHKLRQKARDAIALAKENAPALRLAEETRKKDEQIAVLQKQLTEIAARLDAQEAKKAK